MSALTADDAVATLLTKARLGPDDEADFRATFQAAVESGDTGGLEALMRVYARAGTGPDTTALQDFAADLALVEDVAGKLGPIVALVIEIAPFL